jgi:two-component system response regulator YcbB
VPESAQRFYLVDDDPAVTRMLERVIVEEKIGTVVGRVKEAARAETEILQIRPDVLVIDLLMPEQDGIETITNLRARGFMGSIVMLSWVTDKSMVARAYEAGLAFFIQKPLNRVEIVAVLRRVAAGRRLEQALTQVQNVLSPLRPEGAAGASFNRPRAAREVLADLGILGEAGAQDLQALAETGSTDPLPLGEMYSRLEQHHQAKEGARAPSAKTIEQRIRRSAFSALKHLATLGLDDFANPQFEKFAGRFFDFGEVRIAMAQLQKGRPLEGRLNLKKFLEAFLLEVDLRLHSER